jgi:hypothetical protein
MQPFSLVVFLVFLVPWWFIPLSFCNAGQRMMLNPCR